MNFLQQKISNAVYFSLYQMYLGGKPYPDGKQAADIIAKDVMSILGVTL